MPLKRDLIYIDDKDETDRIAEYSFKGDRCSIIFKNNPKAFSYHKNRAKIVKTAVSGDAAFNVFNYLKEIAEAVGLKTEEGNNILSRSYETITEIPNHCVLSGFLNGSLAQNNNGSPEAVFFPFGFNLSQKDAFTSGWCYHQTAQ